MKTRVCLPAALAAAAALSFSAFAQVSLTKGAQFYDSRFIESYTLENSYLRLTLLPERGGMACELIDKRGGHVNLVYLNPNPGGYGGLFDDHKRWTVTPYKAEVIEQTPQKASIRLSASTDDAAIAKTITLDGDRPAIAVAYDIANTGQEQMGQVLFRNVLRPSGGHFTPGEL
ncbi:MAG TPA: YidC/Oxa1 family insertase periplasmic-domain containing protein, partial [Candidatus Brocadiia bacterium]|nr:YidC/Oxa1 family insertase periplasmic-domain containing protein [Candidatus Brocadiia bacterium]